MDTVAIHQPNFIPWTGYFHKIARCDLFVLLDDAEYTKNGYINRNRIKTPTGWQWLAVPVYTSGRSQQLIRDVQIVNPSQSYRKITGTLQANYGRAPYFNNITEWLLPLFAGDNLAAMNESIIRVITEYIGIRTPVIRASDLNVKGEATERLISICQMTGARCYLAGTGSRNYQDDQLFMNAGIEVKIQQFDHPAYNQLWGGFTPKLSILDWLFNAGKNAML